MAINLIIRMHSITYKGKPNPKEKNQVKIEMTFFKTGYPRVTKVISITGVFKDWDQKNQRFKGRSIESTERNKELEDLKLKYAKVVERWEKETANWSPIEWSHYFEKDEQAKSDVKVKSVTQMIDILIDNFSNKQRVKNGKIVSSFANVKEYKLLKTSLSNFTKEKYKKSFSSYFFRDIQEAFLTDYANWLQLNGKKNGNNGAVIHRLKKLKAVFGYAFKEQMPGANLNIFKCVEMKMVHKKFIPKALSYDIIAKIEKMDRSGFTQTQQFYIDLFLFSFYAGGIPNIDVAYLNWSSIKDNDILQYERMKIYKDAEVPLIQKAWDIINKYKDEAYDDFVFPIFTAKHTTEEKKRVRIISFFAKVNKILHKVSDKIEYDGKITFYAARGSFITRMIDKGMNSFVVAKHAGTSSKMIEKHYYNVTDPDTVKGLMEREIL